MESTTASKKKRIILLCQGGAGDVLAHTPMIRDFRTKYPEDEIVVTSTYAQLFENNPNIDLVVPLKDPKDFYNQYILGKNVRFFRKRFVYDYVLEKQEPFLGATSLPEFICRCFGAAYDSKPLDYFITDYERQCAETFFGQYTDKLPNVLLHCTGAIPSDGQPHKVHTLKDLDVQLIAQLVNKHKDKAKFFHIGLEGEPKVEGAIDCLGMPMRDTIAFIEKADSYIFIESLFAHCSNALNKKGVVVFHNTDPVFFGYGNNFNVSDSGGCDIWPCNRPLGALMDFLPGYKNPKTREKVLWDCVDRKCKKITLETLEKVFLESIQKPVKGNPALEAVRQSSPPNLDLK